MKKIFKVCPFTGCGAVIRSPEDGEEVFFGWICKKCAADWDRRTKEGKK